MEKISGIIPGSARVTSVDLKEASPVRPGTPAFGRPEINRGMNDLKQELGINSTAQKALNAHNELSDWRSKDAKHAAVVSELTDKFFVKNQKEVEPSGARGTSGVTMPQLRATAMDVASRPAGFKTDSTGSFRAAQNGFSRPAFFDDMEEESLPALSQPEGLYPKGSFIDRTA